MPMPHVSEVHPTSHDRHDPMLVAALAAGEVAGGREQAPQNGWLTEEMKPISPPPSSKA